jgi:hypothetical protein
MTLKNFFHNLFEPIYFFISKYYSKQTYIRNYDFFKKKITYKDIYIIGAGPSLNNFKIDKVKNSTFILINGSYEIHNKIEKRNNIFFTTTDVQRINDFIHKLPKKIKCIVSTSKYRGVIDLIMSKNQILYFHPKPSVMFKKFNFLSIFKGKIPIFCPKILTLPIKNLESLLSKNIIINPGSTSMLTILIIIMRMNPKSINLVGFDMGKVNKKHYANLKFYQNNKTAFVKKDIKNAKIILKKILIYLNKKNIKLKNYSSFDLT